MNETATVTESDILADVLAADQGDFTPEVARAVLQWRFTERAVDRMNDLADGNNKGTLTQAEREELEKYLRVGSLLNLLQAKARVSLKHADSTQG